MGIRGHIYLIADFLNYKLFYPTEAMQYMNILINVKSGSIW